MKLKKIITLILLGMLAFTFVACGKQEPVEEETTTVAVNPNVIPTINNMADLERGHFYVETRDGYANPYWGNTNFDAGTSNGRNSNVIWFNDESWQYIPTLYKGQCIVYRTNEEFAENFTFSRFLDEGYTIGICNLNMTSTGRYKYYASTESKNINPASDAYATTEYETNVTIEGIDNKKLRIDRISPCGTITGLEKGKKYKAEIYIGTEYVDGVELTADSRALYGSGDYGTDDYEFIQAEIIRIPIPSYFKSGYYMINGTGIFRYVNGDSYDENTNFNEANPNSMAEAEVLDNLPFYKADLSDEIEFLKSGTYKITFTYDDEINEDLLPDGKTKEDAFKPSVYLNTGEEEITYLEETSENTMSATYEIKEPGMYPFEIHNIYGRGYDYTVEPVEEETEEDAAAEESTESK